MRTRGKRSWIDVGNARSLGVPGLLSGQISVPALGVTRSLPSHARYGRGSVRPYRVDIADR